MFDKLIPWKKRNDNKDSTNLKVRNSDDAFSEIRHDFDRLLSRFWDDGGFASWKGSNPTGAHVAFDESENEYQMTAALPGFEPEEIEVKVSCNVLNVRAVHAEESKRNSGHIQRYGSFYEAFTLPGGVKADSIEASYRSGVLHVRLPKDDSTPPKRIAIKSA